MAPNTYQLVQQALEKAKLGSRRDTGYRQPSPFPTSSLSWNQQASPVSRNLTLPSPISTPNAPKKTGLAMSILGALDFGKSAVASTIKESIDAVQSLFGQDTGFNTSEWWEQTKTHYGFGDLLRDERTTIGLGLMALAPITGGITAGLLSGTALAGKLSAFDSITKHSDRILGFIGDVAIDPLTYMGGYNVMARNLGGYKKVGDQLDNLRNLSNADLSNLAQAAGVKIGKNGAQKMRDIAGKAVNAGQRDRSISSMARVLNKTDEGQAVARALGIDPGLRLRLPGTGPVSRTTRKLDSFVLEGLGLSGAAKKARKMFPEDTALGNLLAQQRVRSIPVAYKRGYTDEQFETFIKKMRKGETDSIPEDVRKFVGTATRAPAEIRVGLPKNATAFASNVFKQADLIPRVLRNFPVTGSIKPIRAMSRMISAQQGEDLRQVFDKNYWKNLSPKDRDDLQGGMTRMFRNRFNTSDQAFGDLLYSGDPDLIAGAWKLENALRYATGRRALLDSIARKGTNRGKVRARIRGGRLTPQEMYPLYEAVARNEILTPSGAINRQSGWFKNLPKAVRDLPDEVLEQYANDFLEMSSGIQEILLKEVPQFRELMQRLEGSDERGHVARRLTDSQRNRWGYNEKFDDFEAVGLVTTQSMRKRNWVPGGEIVLQADAITDARSVGRAVQKPNGDWVINDAVNSRTPYIIGNPSVTQRTVRAELDELSMQVFKEPMYEQNLFTVLDNYNAGMSVEVVNNAFMSELKRMGYPVDALPPRVEKALRSAGAEIQETIAKKSAKNVRQGVAQMNKIKQLSMGYRAAVVEDVKKFKQAVQGYRRRRIANPDEYQDNIPIEELDSRLEKLNAYEGNIEATGAVAAELSEMPDTLRVIGDEIAEIGNNLPVDGKVPERLDRLIEKYLDLAARYEKLNETYIKKIFPVLNIFETDMLPVALRIGRKTATRMQNVSRSNKTLNDTIRASMKEIEDQFKLLNQAAKDVKGQDVSIKHLRRLESVINGTPVVGRAPTKAVATWEDLMNVVKNDDVFGHEDFIGVGVTGEVNVAQAKELLKEVVDDVIRIEESQLLSSILDPAQRTARSATTKYKTFGMTDDEILEATTLTAANAEDMFAEAARLRQQADAAMEMQASLGLDEIPIEVKQLRELALSAEIEAQALAREAADFLNLSGSQKMAASLREAGAPAAVTDFNVAKKTGPQTWDQVWNNLSAQSIDSEMVTTWMDSVKDGVKSWGPWRIATGNTELDEGMVAAAEAFRLMNTPKEVEGFLKSYDKFQNFLKAGMIATPGFVFRNIFGAFFNAWLDGVNPTEMLRAAKMTKRVSEKSYADNTPFIVAARALAKDGDQYMRNYVELLERGVRGGGQATVATTPTTAAGRIAGPNVQAFADARAANAPLSKQDFSVTGVPLQNALSGQLVFTGPRAKKVAVRAATKGEDLFAGSVSPFSSGFVGYQVVRSANTQVEDIIRLGVGLDTMRWGGSSADALERIAKSQFDYGDLTSFEKNVMQRFVPFYTWSRKNIPYQLEQLGKYPYKYNAVMNAKRNLEWGTEDYDYKPDYFLEPFGVRTPFSYAGSTIYSVPDLPFQDLLRYDVTRQTQGELGDPLYGVKKTLQNLTWQISPIVKTPLEIGFQKQLSGYGAPFTGEMQSTPQPIRSIPGLMPALSTIGWAEKVDGDWQMADHTLYMVLSALPALGTIRRVIPSEARYQEKFFETMFSSMAGISIRPLTPEKRESYMKSLRYQQSKIDREKGIRSPRNISGPSLGGSASRGPTLG